jgi:hypothetical protein
MKMIATIISFVFNEIFRKKPDSEILIPYPFVSYPSVPKPLLPEVLFMCAHLHISIIHAPIPPLFSVGEKVDTIEQVWAKSTYLFFSPEAL